MVRQVSLSIGLALALAPAAFAQGRGGPGGPGARGGDGALEERVKKLEAELKELKEHKPAETPVKQGTEELAKARKQVEELGAAMRTAAEKFQAAAKKLAEMEGKPVTAEATGRAAGGFPGGPMMGGGGFGGFGGFGSGMMGGGFGGGRAEGPGRGPNGEAGSGGRGAGRPERPREEGRPMGDAPRSRTTLSSDSSAKTAAPANPEIERMKKEMAEMKAILMEMRDAMKRKP